MEGEKERMDEGGVMDGATMRIGEEEGEREKGEREEGGRKREREKRVRDNDEVMTIVETRQTCQREVYRWEIKQSCWMQMVSTSCQPCLSLFFLFSLSLSFALFLHFSLTPIQLNSLLLMLFLPV